MTLPRAPYGDNLMSPYGDKTALAEDLCSTEQAYTRRIKVVFGGSKNGFQKAIKKKEGKSRKIGGRQN